MSNFLTDSQKNLVRWLVQEVRAGILGEEFLVIWYEPEIGSESSLTGGRIPEVENCPEFTKGALDSLAGLLLFTPNYQSVEQQYSTFAFGNQVRRKQVEVSRNCTFTNLIYEAVDNNFIVQENPSGNQITIGAIIDTMSGGNIQTIGIAQDSNISQILNDPELFQSQIDALTQTILNEVKDELKLDDFVKYTQTLKELKEQVSNKQPDVSLTRRLLQTLSFLGDIEGTIALTTRVWILLHPLIVILAAQLK